MDTGSSLMATPPQMLDPFLSKISSYSNCSSLRQYPTIKFWLEGIDGKPKMYVLEPYEYVLTDESMITYEETDDPEICSFGISIFDVGDENVWIAGDIFLTKYFSVYDRDKDLVGLALTPYATENKHTSAGNKIAEKFEIMLKYLVDSIFGVSKETHPAENIVINDTTQSNYAQIKKKALSLAK
jgi:hypothetical protein